MINSKRCFCIGPEKCNDEDCELVRDYKKRLSRFYS